MQSRSRRHTYQAVLGDARQWELLVDGAHHSVHRTLRDAQSAAADHDRRARARARALRHVLILLTTCMALGAIMPFRNIANPDYPPASAFAAAMERAYRAIEDGSAGIADFSAEVDGFAGGSFEVDRGQGPNEYFVLVGEHDADCYLIRWRRDRAPFVARLLPQYPCVPGDRTLSFDPAGFEAIAVNLDLGGVGPLEWDPVTPPENVMATWFLPAVIVGIFIVLMQLVSLSLLALGGVPARAVDVERIEGRPA